MFDPDVVAHPPGRSGLADQLARLSERERGAHADGGGPVQPGDRVRLVIDIKTVESHIARVMTKLDLHQTPDEHRRVLTVLAWLRS